MQSLVVSGIIIYPVKSLGGISLQQSCVQLKGLALDRRWMLVDENNRFLSQREHSQLALFKVGLPEGDNCLLVRYENDICEIPMHGSGKYCKANIWDDTVGVQAKR